jgi:NAD(P)-dependent dehydrogenase (short-subunit alcohol dehydrogenase family)
MDLDFGGKLALITGGSSGIGRAVEEALAAEGCRLVLVSCRAADLDVARSQIEGHYNVSVRTDAADLGDSTNVVRLARLFPDVDILVNNAGAIPGGTLFDVDEARGQPPGRRDAEGSGQVHRIGSGAVQGLLAGLQPVCHQVQDRLWLEQCAPSTQPPPRERCR